MSDCGKSPIGLYLRGVETGMTDSSDNCNFLFHPYTHKKQLVEQTWKLEELLQIYGFIFWWSNNNEHYIDRINTICRKIIIMLTLSHFNLFCWAFLNQCFYLLHQAKDWFPQPTLSNSVKQKLICYINKVCFSNVTFVENKSDWQQNYLVKTDSRCTDLFT